MQKTIYLLLLTWIVSLQVISQETKNLHRNMGSNINTSDNENGPRISPDGKTLYFWRFEEDSAQSHYIWKSELDKNGQWKKAKKMKKPFNTTGYDGIRSVGKYGNSVIVDHTYKNGEFDGDGFSISKKIGGKWSEFETILIDEYNEMALGMYKGISMSNDGTVLILHFSEQKESTEGDLYVSFIKGDDTWTKPVKIKGSVNSEWSELSPFISADGATLYFTSNREGGVGCYDIYMTSRLDDTWLNWTEPINLGTSVNTNVCEMFLSLDASEKYAYFGSLKNSEYGVVDIVKVELPDSLKPSNQKEIIPHEDIFISDYTEDFDLVKQTSDEEGNFSFNSSINHINHEDFRIYPNPVDDNFFVEISGEFKEQIVVSIISANGQLLRTDFINELPGTGIYKKRFDVSSYAAGTYIISFNDGKVIVSKRIVIK